MKEKNYSFLDRRQHLFMSIDNLKKIHNDGHTLGLHSDTHPTGIHNFSYDRQLKEYTKNYEFISSITKEKIHAVAHPCGHYNSSTLKILKKLGVEIGFISSKEPSNIKSSLLIPRVNYADIISDIKAKL
jgi:peptidoglycan/xylan/chitin deacetylase (PgdA/CDA1 family)